MSPRGSFFDGKLFLVGDALAAYPLHVGTSTNQAPLDVLLLENLMKGDLTVQQCEGQGLQYV